MKSVVASEIMNPNVVVVRSDMSVHELAEFLIENEISGAPVADADGRLVGVVSLTDIAVAASGESGIARDRSNPDFYVRGWEDRLEDSEMAVFHLESDGLAVGDVMNPDIYSVLEDAPVSEVAHTMLEGHLHRLLVMRDKAVVGIITTSDLLRLLT